MTLLSNADYKQRFSSIAKIYEKISNPYTVNRRAELFKIRTSELVLEVGSGTGMVSDLVDEQIRSVLGYGKNNEYVIYLD